jgi:hypothetical protein
MIEVCWGRTSLFSAMSSEGSFPTHNARVRAHHGVIHGCVGWLAAPSNIATPRLVAVPAPTAIGDYHAGLCGDGALDAAAPPGPQDR